jgi:hypothetical protein
MTAITAMTAAIMTAKRGFRYGAGCRWRDAADWGG